MSDRTRIEGEWGLDRGPEHGQDHAALPANENAREYPAEPSEPAPKEALLIAGDLEDPIQGHSDSSPESERWVAAGDEPAGAEEPPVFSSEFNPIYEAPPGFTPEAQVKPPVRTPNFADALLFLVLLLMGVLVTSGVLGAALYFHWFDRWLGIHGLEDAAKSTPVALGTQLMMYVIALSVAVPLFRMIWRRAFFSGLHWNGVTAYRFRYVLFGTAVVCNLLAIAGNWLLPFPQHAPIDKLFGTQKDAWLLACFGVAIAPFFEEMIFRGFLLPALATAWDWLGERLHHRLPKPPDTAGNPIWSGGATVFAALLVSAPFALMHSAQVGNSWGPVTLLYCISLILCAVRLKTRSLAASTLVHASYNFLLFAVMFAETGGFRHMDKM